jgi:hypothetical protein
MGLDIYFCLWFLSTALCLTIYSKLLSKESKKRKIVQYFSLVPGINLIIYFIILPILWIVNLRIVYTEV